MKGERREKVNAAVEIQDLLVRESCSDVPNIVEANHKHL
jgi:hypothetical protein